MRIIMGRVRRDSPVRPAVGQNGRTNRPNAAQRPGSQGTTFYSGPPIRKRTVHRHAAQPSGRGTARPGKAVFVLVALAFVVTGGIGLRLGTQNVGQAAVKAAVLSAQMSYPQGGENVAAREMAKLRAWFARLGRADATDTAPQSASGKTQSASSKAQSASGRTAASTASK